MKFSKKAKKSFKKKVFKRKPKFYQPKVYRPRVLNRANLGRGFPNQMIMTHRYVQTDSLANTAGAIDYQVYSCNSMFDPDVTGTGHQPLNFDQMAAIYNYYTVIGSKITIRVAGLITGSGGDHTPCIFALQQHPLATPTSTDPVVVAEQGKSIIKMNGPAQFNPFTFKSTWSAKKVFGGNTMADTNLQGTSSSGPAEQTYWTLSCKPIDLLSTTGFQLIVTIDYIAVWHELKTIPQS